MPVLGVTEPMLTGGQTSAEGAGAVIYLAALGSILQLFCGFIHNISFQQQAVPRTNLNRRTAFFSWAV